MDIAEQKYENFKKFVTEIMPKDNPQINLLTSANLGLFLRTLKNYDNMDEDQILNHIINLAKLNKSDYQDQDINKFKRYLEYFKKITKLI